MIKSENGETEGKIHVRLSNNEHVYLRIPGYTISRGETCGPYMPVSRAVENLISHMLTDSHDTKLILNILNNCTKEEIRKDFPEIWEYVNAAMHQKGGMEILKTKWKQLYLETEEFCSRIRIE